MDSTAQHGAASIGWNGGPASASNFPMGTTTPGRSWSRSRLKPAGHPQSRSVNSVHLSRFPNLVYIDRDGSSLKKGTHPSRSLVPCVGDKASGIKFLSATFVAFPNSPPPSESAPSGGWYDGSAVPLQVGSLNFGCGIVAGLDTAFIKVSGVLWASDDDRPSPHNKRPYLMQRTICGLSVGRRHRLPHGS